ncbi:MAG: tetratricopeptide (TPR) repeat protein [Planctomycetaceae bacterium]|jgi:tetratricopeptide (TPR) repeat protein
MRAAWLTCLGAVMFAGRFWASLSHPSVDELGRLCEAASRRQQWTTLQEHAERWTGIEPHNGNAWMYAARAKQQQRKYDQAAICLTRVPDDSPEFQSAQFAQVELAFGPRNRPREGASVCELILARDPQSRLARQRLIFFLAMTLQRSRLQTQIRAAINSESEPPEAYVYLFFLDSLHFSNATIWNGQWIQGNVDSELFEVAQAVCIAQTLDTSISMDDREESIAARRALEKKGPVMDELLERYPHNIELLAYHLRENVKSGNVGRVLSLLSQAPEESESDGRFWRYKGWVNFQRGELTAAEVDYNRALELHPLDWATRHFLAELYQRKQNFQEAGRLRELVRRANELRRTLHAAPSAREVPEKVLRKLVGYAADCGDTQMADALQRRLR